jgi:hypothetical protein
VALASGQRFIKEDLNRIWSAGEVERLRSFQGPGELGADRFQQLELLKLIDDLFQRAGERRRVIFVDLHTTSACGGPFTIFGDTLANRSFAANFPVPMILGLEEQIDGALLDYVGSQGAVTLGFEAGPHTSAESVQRQEAMVSLTLVAAGIIQQKNCQYVVEFRRRLAEASAKIPPVIEVIYRHPVAHEDQFKMIPGFTNFELVKKGQKLARDKDGSVLAPIAGRILLPLYQTQGSDGFFIVNSVWPFWLKLSRFLRQLKLDSFLPFLPGITAHPGQEGALLADPCKARWKTVEIFHLLGYRKCRPEEGSLVFSRRSEPAPKAY